MQYLTLTLKAGLSDSARHDLLNRIESLPGVRTAGQINPSAQSPEMQRFCKLIVDEDAPVNSLIARLKQIPEVSSAELPPQRRLITPVPNSMSMH